MNSKKLSSYLVSDNPHANTTSIPNNSDRPESARPSASHLDNELQVTELKLLELRSMINQALGSVALGPPWESRTTTEVNRRLSRNGLTFDPHRIKATSGHRLLIDPRCTSPSTRKADSNLMSMSLGAITEEYGENKGEHKGRGKEEETRARFSHKIGHGYPTSALNPTSAGLSSLSVPIKHRERSTTIPRPSLTGSHSTTPYKLSRQHGALPATPSPSTNSNGIITSTSGSTANFGTNTNTSRIANVRTSSLPRTPQDQLTRPVPRTASLGQRSNYTSHQQRSQSRDNPSSIASPVAFNGSPLSITRHPLPPTPPQSDESERSSPSNSPSHFNKKNRLSSTDHKGWAGSPVKPPTLMTMSPTTVTLRSLNPVDPSMSSKVCPRPLPPRPDVARSLSPV